MDLRRLLSDCRPVRRMEHGAHDPGHHDSDDHVRVMSTYVYLNLWSDIDPSEMAETIRQAMFGYGFGMLEESDKGHNRPAYDPPTKTYTVQWTWVWFEEVDYGR